jgi:hypothetical protein
LGRVSFQGAFGSFRSGQNQGGHRHRYVTDGYAKSIWRIPAKGKPEEFFSGEPLKNPVGLAKQGEKLLIADPHQKMIYSLPLTGEKTIQSELK